MSNPPPKDIIEDNKDDDARFKKVPMTPEQEKLVEKYKDEMMKFVKEAFRQDK
jgi:hypothetical protein